jgi:RimJ/RimL family protein N-acetyltransferase
MNFGENFEDVLNIFNSFSEEDRRMVSTKNFENIKNIKYRKVLYINDKPISFFELYVPKNYINEGYIVIGTKEEFRGMGYSTILIKKAEEELKRLNYKKLYWTFLEENKISKNMAINLGYKPLKGRIYYKRIK